MSASKPNWLGYAGRRWVNGTPVRAEIEALKKLFGGFVALDNTAACGVPALIVAESPNVPRSPSVATRPRFVVTGPDGGVRKPDSGMSTGGPSASTNS